jgi:hypothetical protein
MVPFLLEAKATTDLDPYFYTFEYAMGDSNGQWGTRNTPLVYRSGGKTVLVNIYYMPTFGNGIGQGKSGTNHWLGDVRCVSSDGTSIWNARANIPEASSRSVYIANVTSWDIPGVGTTSSVVRFYPYGDTTAATIFNSTYASIMGFKSDATNTTQKVWSFSRWLLGEKPNAYGDAQGYGSVSSRYFPFTYSGLYVVCPPALLSHYASDADYQAFAAAEGARRRLVLAQSNGGMVHGIDETTGV